MPVVGRQLSRIDFDDRRAIVLHAREQIPVNPVTSKPVSVWSWNALCLGLCRHRAGRLLLHAVAVVRRPRNVGWHLRCMIRDVRNTPTTRLPRVSPDRQRPDPSEPDAKAAGDNERKP